MALQQALRTDFPRQGVRLSAAAPVTPPPDPGAEQEKLATAKETELAQAQQNRALLEQKRLTAEEKRGEEEGILRTGKAVGEAREQAAAAERLKAAPQRAELQEKVQQEKDFYFRPSQEDGMMMASLASLVAVLGASIGRGGKANAMAALSGMNGMMQGYQQGRDDIYKKEKAAFETNLKALRDQMVGIRTALQNYEKTVITDRDTAIANLHVDLAKQGADFKTAQIQREGPLKQIPVLDAQIKQLEKAIDGHKSKAADARTRAQAAAESVRFRQEEAEKNRLARTETMLLANQLALDRQRERQDARGAAPSKKADEGRVLAPPEARKIEAFDSAALALQQLKDKWKPEYAQMGMPGGIGSGLVYEAARRGVSLTLGPKEAQDAVDWWAAYEALQAPQRHALFGSAFTKGEQDSWKTFSAQKTDSADTVKTMVERQIKHAKQQAAGLRVFYGDAGYRVPAARPRDWTGTEFTPPPRDEGIAPAGGAPAAPAAGPKEGDKASSKSGRPMVYRGGQWVYE